MKPDGTTGDLTEDTMTDNDVEEHKFKTVQVPKVSITKTAETATVDLGKQVNYLITVKNESEEGGEELENPVIMDLLPQGVTVEGNSFAQINGENSEISVGTLTAPSFDGNVVAVIPLTGTLEPGESVVVKLTATVNSNVPNYSNGRTIRNYAFVTSYEPGVRNADNKDAIAFKDKNDQWAKDLITSATEVGLDSTRAENLANCLTNAGITGYGYLGASADVSWTSTAGMLLSKENKGDLDEAYQSSGVANASRDGWVDYKLTLGNNSGEENRSHLKVLDALPTVGDISGTFKKFNSQHQDTVHGIWILRVYISYCRRTARKIQGLLLCGYE